MTALSSRREKMKVCKKRIKTQITKQSRRSDNAPNRNWISRNMQAEPWLFRVAAVGLSSTKSTRLKCKRCLSSFAASFHIRIHLRTSACATASFACIAKGQVRTCQQQSAAKNFQAMFAAWSDCMHSLSSGASSIFWLTRISGLQRFSLVEVVIFHRNLLT